MEQLGSLPIGEIPRTLAAMLINEIEKKKLQAGCRWRMWRDEAGKTAPNYSLLVASRKTLDSPSISGGCSFRLSQPQLLLRLLQVLLSPSGRGHRQGICKEQLWDSPRLQGNDRERGSNTDTPTLLTKPTQTEPCRVPENEKSNKPQQPLRWLSHSQGG